MNYTYISFRVIFHNPIIIGGRGCIAPLFFVHKKSRYIMHPLIIYLLAMHHNFRGNNDAKPSVMFKYISKSSVSRTIILSIN